MNNYLERFLSKQNSKHTRTAYEYNVNQMLDYVDKDVNNITFGDLVDYKEHFSKRYSSNSMAQKIRCLRSYFDYLYYDIEVIDSNPIVNKKGLRIKEDKVVEKKQTYFPMVDIKQLIQNGKNSRDKAIIAVFATIGLRVSELIELTLEDYKRKTVTIITKGEKEREIIFNESCCKYVDQYLKDRKQSECNNLFISNQRTPMRPEVINRTLKVIAKQKDIHPHSIRHSVVSEVLKEYDIETARQFIGHSNIATTMRYVHSTNEEVRNVAIGMSI